MLLQKQKRIFGRVKLSAEQYSAVCSIHSAISKTTFSVRVETLHIKACNSWNYDDTIYEMCFILNKDMKHFMSFKANVKVPCKILKISIP